MRMLYRLLTAIDLCIGLCISCFLTIFNKEKDDDDDDDIVGRSIVLSFSIIWHPNSNLPDNWAAKVYKRSELCETDSGTLHTPP